MRDEVFGDESPIGYVHSTERRDYVVVGVVGDYRYRGEFEDHIGGFFRRSVLSDTTANTQSIALFSVRSDAGVQFEQRLVEHLSTVAGGMNARIETMEATRASYIKGNLMELAVPSVIAGFLVLNVALGLFGVLWYSISRRRGEVGLRRAVGANAAHISRQILGEAAVLTTFAVIFGIFIAVQAPLLGLDPSIGGAVYVFAMACSAGIIYLIVSICALYPSWLASKIRPALALHDD
jgi:putative ABC transport system permease protein